MCLEDEPENSKKDKAIKNRQHAHQSHTPISSHLIGIIVPAMACIPHPGALYNNTILSQQKHIIVITVCVENKH